MQVMMDIAFHTDTSATVTVAGYQAHFTYMWFDKWWYQTSTREAADKLINAALCASAKER